MGSKANYLLNDSNYLPCANWETIGRVGRTSFRRVSCDVSLLKLLLIGKDEPENICNEIMYLLIDVYKNVTLPKCHAFKFGGYSLTVDPMKI